MKSYRRVFIPLVVGLALWVSVSAAISQGRATDRKMAYLHGVRDTHEQLVGLDENRLAQARMCVVDQDTGKLLDNSMTYDQAYEVGVRQMMACYDEAPANPQQ